jgi:nucleoside-diphosphate-sugar epimerase
MINYDGRLDEEPYQLPLFKDIPINQESPKLLVMGGAGFIGSVLCTRLLERGYRVHCLDNFANSNKNTLIHIISNPNFTFEYFDCSNLYTKKGYDCIFNLAGLVGFPKCSNNSTLSHLWNIKVAKRVAETALLTGCKVVHSSTGSVYGALSEVCTETSPTNPVSIYGKDKLAAEAIIKEVPHSISLRFATGFGLSYSHRGDLLPNTFMELAIKNKCLSIFEPNAKRSFISVEQMARAFIFAYENYSKSQYSVYNVGNDKLNLTKMELAKIVNTVAPCEIQEISGKDADLRDYNIDYSRLKDFGLVISNDMIDQLRYLKKYYEV